MPTMPRRRLFTKKVHEWAIETPCDAKDFRFQVHHIENQISDLIGKKSEYDDAYEVIVGDDEIIFRVTVKVKDT